MAQVHPSAIVDPRAELAADVTVGPFCIIGPGVTVGAGSQIGSHVVPWLVLFHTPPPPVAM